MKTKKVNKDNKDEVYGFTLTDDEKLDIKIGNMYLDGFSEEEIAEELDVDIDYVCEIFEESIFKARKMFLDGFSVDEIAEKFNYDIDSLRRFLNYTARREFPS